MFQDLIAVDHKNGTFSHTEHICQQWSTFSICVTQLPIKGRREKKNRKKKKLFTVGSKDRNISKQHKCTIVLI